ncbi:hypothetical protein Tco_1479852 [Tanacetum coccineum]
MPLTSYWCYRCTFFITFTNSVICPHCDIGSIEAVDSHAPSDLRLRRRHRHNHHHDLTLFNSVIVLRAVMDSHASPERGFELFYNDGCLTSWSSTKSKFGENGNESNLVEAKMVYRNSVKRQQPQEISLVLRVEQWWWSSRAGEQRWWSGGAAVVERWSSGGGAAEDQWWSGGGDRPMK